MRSTMHSLPVRSAAIGGPELPGTQFAAHLQVEPVVAAALNCRILCRRQQHASYFCRTEYQDAIHPHNHGEAMLRLRVVQNEDAPSTSRCT